MQNPFQIGDHHTANTPLESLPASQQPPNPLSRNPDTRHEHTSHTVCSACQYQPGWIRAAYALAIVFWLGLVIFLGFQPCWLLDWVLVLLPVVLFVIAIATAGQISPYVELWTLRSSTISNVVILIFPILVWATARVDNTVEFLLLVLTATGLSVISLLDLWVTEPYLNVVKHLRSICQTLAIVLTLLALLQYYKDRKRDYDLKLVATKAGAAKAGCQVKSTEVSDGVESIDDIVAAALV